MSRLSILRTQRRLKRHKPKTWCVVYGLREISDGPIMYIGQTRMAISERLRFHLKAPTRRRLQGRKFSPCERWIAGLMAKGAIPTIEIVDPNGVWDISEAVWIDRLKHAELLNINSLIPEPIQ